MRKLAAASRVVVRGELGIGISRLLDELTGRLGDLDGVVVCRGQAEAPRSGVPYAALAEALDSALEQVPREERDIASLTLCISDAQMQAGLTAGAIDVSLGSGPGLGFRAKGVPAIGVAGLPKGADIEIDAIVAL
jgi:hypothetical protein